MIYEVIDNILGYYPEAEVSGVEQAYVLMAKLCGAKSDCLGEPYLTHSLNVAKILTGMHLDVATVTAALLHESMEYQLLDREELETVFGSEVANLVAGVTRISSLEYTEKTASHKENLIKMILSLATDLRILLIKLADRLDQMRRLRCQPSDTQLAVASETLDIYAPIANRLGIDWMKKELEDLAFYYLDPFAYQEIINAIAKKSEEQEEYISKVKQIISEKLAERGLSARVLGRVKHVYSIYRKMLAQNIDIDHIYDIIAFRVILKDVANCYEALSIIHSMWEPIPGRYKDYIGKPKPNMYQSLHTSVIGPFGERMEIQIRTEKMDRIANEGIAAHWAYKEGRKVDEGETERFSWIRQLLEVHQEIKNPKDFIRSVKFKLFPDEVYVFTPDGEVKAFPKGSTPIDFAYSIHSEVGHHCVGARINGKMVPLKYKLQTGDVVEIITSSKQRPSSDWLNIARTSKAKSRIRHWFKAQETERSISLGREILEKEFRKRSLNFSHFINSDILHEVAVGFSLKSVKDLLANVGYGKISPGQVVGKLCHLTAPEEKVEKPEEVEPEPDVRKKLPGGVKVKGVSDILVRLARCCSPLPGEPIVGYITKGHGITVHRAKCPNILKGSKDRIIDVEWDETGDGVYPVGVDLICSNSKGMLATISAALSNLDINIHEARINARPDEKSLCRFVLEVRNYGQLQKALSVLRNTAGIFQVWRRGFSAGSA